jgi:glycine dehydrogenase subunit 2
MLCEICGLGAFTLQPAAGAHGELTGLMIIKAYFNDKGENRVKILTPDSSHGTNPASSSMCGFETITIKSDDRGQVDIEDLKKNLDNEVAAVMLTIPNTLGIFEENILEITKLIHDNGSLVYMDGANMNALLGNVRPGDMGIDVLHLNLHKTFSTPHGGGGPGSGPVGVKSELKEFLPNPYVVLNEEVYSFANYPKSIGKVKAFYGNFGVMVRAFTYIRAIGAVGLKAVSDNAVLNANYMKEKLREHYKLPYDCVCKHEFVLSDEEMPNEVTTNDIAKRLLDYGFHPPTVYFPLNVHGAIMIEPNETESKEMLDKFIEVMIKIKDESNSDPDIVKGAPHTTIVKRLDAVKAARELNLRFLPDN